MSRWTKSKKDHDKGKRKWNIRENQFPIETLQEKGPLFKLAISFLKRYPWLKRKKGNLSRLDALKGHAKLQLFSNPIGEVFLNRYHLSLTEKKGNVVQGRHKLQTDRGKILIKDLFSERVVWWLMPMLVQRLLFIYLFEITWQGNNLSLSEEWRRMDQTDDLSVTEKNKFFAKINYLRLIEAKHFLYYNVP